MPFSPDDTICALSTPQGPGAIAVVRVDGAGVLARLAGVLRLPGHLPVAQMEPRRAYFATVADGHETLDEVVATYFRGPRSYTGNDLVEIACHGSLFIQRRLLQLLADAGCRAAGPGEFTLRAFLNGKMDLTRAEGVGELVDARNAFAHKAAMQQMRGGFARRVGELSARLLRLMSLVELELDFADEDVAFADRGQIAASLSGIIAEVDALAASHAAGQVLKSGVPVAIVGRPNVGKSTLMNSLLRDDRSIVSPVAGTTRDTVEGAIALGGVDFRFVDTAGLRPTSDPVESLGIARAWDQLAKAWVVLFVFEATDQPTAVAAELAALRERCAPDTIIYGVANKCDLVSETAANQLIATFSATLELPSERVVALSARDTAAVASLADALTASACSRFPDGDAVLVANARQHGLLQAMSREAGDALSALNQGLTGDLLALHLRRVLDLAGELTGSRISPDMVLGEIFAGFCIGK